MPFEFEKQSIEDVILITPKVFGDNRGFFMETYKKTDFEQNGIIGEFNQDNHSKSSKGVLRGLHYQEEPHAQAKIVRCIKGRIFDDIAEQFEQTLNKKTEPENKVTSNIEDNKSENNFLSLLGNNFGPPPGLNIEGFNYSLIQ